MSRTYTRAQLRTRARERADMESQGAIDFADDSEINDYIDASYARWHGLVAKAYPERYESTDTITGSGAGSYALPADHMTTLSVDYQADAETWRPLKRVQFHERTRYSNTTTGEAIGYYLSGSNVVLVPDPSSGSYRHTYVTMAPKLTSDSDTVDGVNGWEEWIVLDVAIKLLMKEESSVSALQAERNHLGAEIEAVAADREAANPLRVVDTRTYSLRYSYRDPDFWSNR